VSAAALRRAVRFLRVVAALGCALVVLSATAAPAGAHAVLIASDPASDALVEAPPAQIVLRYDEGVEGSSDAVRVLDPSGGELPGVRSTVSGVTVTAELPELTQDGSYTVNWSVVSADGHPIRGAYLFHLRERTLDEPADAVTSGTPLSATVLRALGAVLAIGGLVGVFASWFLQRRPPARWVPVVTGTLLSLGGAVLAVGESWSTSWGIVVDTTSGRMSLVAVVVALIGWVVSMLPRAGAEELAVAAAASVAVAAQGHAVSIAPVALSAGLTVAHVAAAIAWGAALLWLDGRTRDGDGAGLAAAVRRLSPWGMGAVVVLAVSGAVLVVDRVGLDQLTTSTYGRLSLLKVALLVVAVVLAARHRWRLAPTLGDDAGAVTRLQRSVRVEVVVLALALVAGAALAQVRPPDAAGAATAGGAFDQRLAFGDGTVELTVEPGNRGTNEMHVTALGPDGRLMEGVDDLSLALTLPSDGVGPLEPEMLPITTGHAMSYAEFPLAGTWTVEVRSRPSKFEELRAEFTVPIGE
jgi:copper transport protein